MPTLVEQMISFGVGCLTFECTNRTDDKTLLAERYLHASRVLDEQLESVLQAIPSISDLTIDPPRDYRFAPVAPAKAPVEVAPGLHVHSGGSLWPHPSIGGISFSIRVPRRFQESLVDRYLGTEDFRVAIQFGWFFPFSIVSFPTPDASRYDGSTAMRLVARFVGQEIDRTSPNAELQLVLLGPSPMHVDGVVAVDTLETERPTGEEPASGLVWSSRSPFYGYDLLHVFHTADVHPQDALHEFMAMHEDEIALYYELQSQRSVDIDTWSVASDKLWPIVDLFESDAARDRLRRFVFGGAAIRKAGLGILRATSDSHRRRLQMRSDIASTRSNLMVEPFLETECLDIVRELESFEIPEAKEIVALLEGRRANDMQAISLAIGTIIGLGVGAGLTTWITG